MSTSPDAVRGGTWLALFALGFLVLFPPLIQGGTTHLPVTVIRVFTVAALLAWFMDSTGRGSLRLPGSGLGLPVGLFILAAFFSYLIAPYKFLAWQRLASIINYALILYIFLHLLGKAGARAAFLMVSAMAGLEAAFGVFQAHALGLARATGTFFNPDYLGGYLAMAAPAMLFAAIGPKGRPSARVRATAAALFFLAGYCVLLTHSRGAFLALALGCAVVLAYRFGWRGLAAALVAASLVLVLTPSLRERFTAGAAKDPLSYYRVQIWKNAAQRVRAAPLGEGLGGYSIGTAKHNFPAPRGPAVYGKVAESAHNSYLQVAVEMGVIPFALLLWGMALLAVMSVRALGPPGDDDKGFEGRALALGSTAGLAAFFGHGLVDTNFMQPSLVMLALLMAAVIITRARELAGRQGHIELPVNAGPLARYGAVLLAALLSVYVSMPLLGWMSFDEFSSRDKAAGCTDAGMASLERAVFFSPVNASYHNALASCLFVKYNETKDPALLERSLYEAGLAVEASPEDSYYSSRKAFLLSYMAGLSDGGRRAELLGESYSLYNKAIELQPARPQSYLEAAGVAAALGRPAEAAALLERSLAYEPNYLPARLALARLMLSLGEQARAREELVMVKAVLDEFSAKGHIRLKRAGYFVSPQEVEYLLGEVGGASR